MGNIIDYIKWRGDLDFSERDFNEIDNLVFSMLAYIDFQGIVATNNEDGTRSLAEAAEMYREQHDIEKVPELLEAMADSKRYQNIGLSNYIEILDYTEEKTQFAAIHIKIDDKTDYISFRGTDRTIVGWREDFAMSFQIIPAQKYAVDYLRQNIDDLTRTYYVGGHSKGGNLAVYASMNLPKEMRASVKQIYSNDGPGLCADIIQPETYEEVDKKLIRIIPDFSLIGTLFEKRDANYIVCSNVDGVIEHDAYTWQIQGDSFVIANDLKEKCKGYKRVFREWIEDVDIEQRQVFVKDFFDSLEVGGATTMEEVFAGGLSNFEDVLFSFGRSKKESKLVVGKLLKSFFKGITRIDLLGLIHTKQMIQAIGFLMVGILFVCFREIAPHIVGTAFFLWLLFYSALRIYKFYKSYQNHEEIDKYKVLFYVAIAGIEVLCIVQNHIVLISVNLIFGLFFLWSAWQKMKLFVRCKKYGKKIWIFHLIHTLLLGGYGIVSLAISNQESGIFTLSAGSYLVIIGFCKAIKAMYDNIENPN